MANTKETAKKPYQEPKVVDYGKVADLTKKPAVVATAHPAPKVTRAWVPEQSLRVVGLMSGGNR
jgi:hypothetical protein